MGPRLRIGISTCLLGENTRYDGGNCLDRFITDTLGTFFEFVPVCPEVEFGFSIPREPLHLVGDPAAPRLMTRETRVDYTGPMLKWAVGRVRRLETEDLNGFIFKSASPSSGMERVKVYSGKGPPKRVGVGLFAREFMKHFPLIPVIDEIRVHDLDLRGQFMESTLVLRRWRELVRVGPTREAAVDFHSRHELLLRAHSPQYQNQMAKMVAVLGRNPTRKSLAQYQALLIETLRRRATIKKHANVLRYCLSLLRKTLDAEEARELEHSIEMCRQGHVPFIVPATLIGYFARKYHQPYLEQQYYLAPGPLELQLRYHV